MYYIHILEYLVDCTVSCARITSIGCVSIVANVPALAPAIILHIGVDQLLDGESRGKF